MTGIHTYSTTASENVQANTGINWDEGMAPSAVNDSARQNMADIRGRWNDAAWFQYGIGSKTVAATYASGTSITLAGGDATTAWHANRRVKATGTSTGTIYGKVSSSSYNSGTTTTTVNFTWDSGSLSNETLTVYLSAPAPVTGHPIAPESIGGGTLGSAIAVADTNFTLQDDSDATKQAKFQASGITTGNTRTLTFPDRSDTIATLGGDQSFTGNITLSGANATITVSPTGTGKFITAGATAGSIDNVIIGGTTPLAGTFTTLTATTQLIGKGTATNDSAAAGEVGEVIESFISNGSAVSLVSNTAKDITTISLTAGDWDVTGSVWLSPAGTTTFSTNFFGWSSLTSATLPSAGDRGVAMFQNAKATGAAQNLTLPKQRISVSTTTTVYLGTYVTFGVSTCTAYGNIIARRVR